ncbi:MAG: hypothetical protein ACLQVN_21880 [Bryobacteraceae bacterium]
MLRTRADATQLRIWVHSGAHSQKDLPLELGPATAIAYILLTPGADRDLSDFAHFLDWPPYWYGDPAYVNQRLEQPSAQLEPGPKGLGLPGGRKHVLGSS